MEGIPTVAAEQSSSSLGDEKVSGICHNER